MPGLKGSSASGKSTLVRTTWGCSSTAVNAITTGIAGNVIAGGWFSQAGTVAANNVAKWNGTAWEPMGAGLTGIVYAVTTDAAGRIYAGGAFTTSGSTAVSNIARWTGTEWEPLGSGLNGTVDALVTDAAGNVYAGGSFTQAGIVSTPNVAKWNGTTWSSLGSGTDGIVNALTFDTAGNLYAGGQFSNAGGVASSRVAEWNGTAWVALPGLTPTTSSGSQVTSIVRGLTRDSMGRITAVGAFSTNAMPRATQSVAQWNGNTWVGLGTGTTGIVYAVTPQANGGIVAGGKFTFTGTAVAGNVSSWNGTQWSAIGGGINNPVNALYTDPSGNVYAGGSFSVADGVATSNIAVNPVVNPATQPATAPCAATFYQQAPRTWQTVTHNGRRAVKVVSRLRIFQEPQSWCQTKLTFILQNAVTLQRLSQLPGSTLGYRTLQGQVFNAPVISWPTASEFRFNSGDLTGQNRVNARLVLVSYIPVTQGMPTQPNVELMVVRQIPTNPANPVSTTNPIYAQINAMGTTMGWAQVN